MHRFDHITEHGLRNMLDQGVGATRQGKKERQHQAVSPTCPAIIPQRSVQGPQDGSVLWWRRTPSGSPFSPTSMRAALLGFLARDGCGLPFVHRSSKSTHCPHLDTLRSAGCCLPSCWRDRSPLPPRRVKGKAPSFGENESSSSN